MIEETFKKTYGAAPEVVARGPGRGNLIGEDTAYNDGFVLPAALDRAIQAAGRRGPDRTGRGRARRSPATRCGTCWAVFAARPKVTPK